jgi:1-deoxy-D-xylulose-5-phosphate reductoisomerase
MKTLSILGSTGSIGRNALRIVEMFPERFAVKALSAKSSTTLLAEQIETFRPEVAVVFDEERALELKNTLSGKNRVEILYGDEGYQAAAALDSVNMVLTAMVGAAGLMPTLAAIEAKKDIALANKETLVMAGELVMGMAAEKGVQIIPVDSEHSAIFQCLRGHRREDLQKILLTASGGPFLNRPGNEFSGITPEEALAHPTWQMGKKISIDSATLMNKGFEVIEAQHLFNASVDMIEVVIHPQSFIHSMVAYTDGAIIAQIGVPDMKGAIAYALSYPERMPLNEPLPDFAEIGQFVFQGLDREKFPGLDLSFRACKAGGTLPAVLNAANEVAVNRFLLQDIRFDQIPVIIKMTMDRHRLVKPPLLSDILAADKWARGEAEALAQDLRA